ncbi:tetratricopeptide repeat protein [Maribacter halichondriae]|uniref:tetratricopeptide repeat protein n=1 Tax=Maribacter halichondriae TaxID=2980554 RepID=UPI0023599025|nr:tetratricopeptide repeat protein [Maribacter sp. Hal144]
MERLLKYCLSVFMLCVSITSCEKSLETGRLETNKQLSEELFKEEFGTHDHLKPIQGSPASMTMLDSILKLDTTNAAAWREISIPYLKRGMPHQWKPLINKAVYHDAKTWQPMRGYLYLIFYRNYKKAIADFDASDTLTDYIDHPQGHSVDFWRGIAYLGLKDYKNSISYWDKHIKRETEESGEDWVELEAFLYRGIAYYESGNFDKALEDFDKAIHYFKQTADAKFYKALILNEQGNSEEAIRMLEDAMVDFKAGFFNNRDYVEALRQIYLEDLEDLKKEILQGN